MDERKFVADLIQALKDAEKTSKTPKNQLTRAQETYSSLQFDFPLKTAEDVSALANIFAANQPPPSWAKLTDKFIEVVLENAVDNDIQHNDNGTPPAPLTIAYQRLLSSSLLSTLKSCFEAPDNKQLDQLLNGITLPSEVPFDHANTNCFFLETSESDEDLDADDDIVSKTIQNGQEKESSQQKQHSRCDFPKHYSHQQTTSNEQFDKMIHISSKLHYSRINQAWNVSHVSQCLASLRNQKDFLQLLPIAGTLCTLLHDRAVAAPAEADVIMKSLLSGLEVERAHNSMDDGTNAAIALSLGTTSSLILHFTGHSRASSVAARRKLYGPLRDVIIPAAARALEKCEAQRAQRARRAQHSSDAVTINDTSTKSANKVNDVNANIPSEEQEELHIITSTSVIVEFFVTEGVPPIAKPIHASNLLQSSGILGSLTLAYIRRCAAMRPFQRTVLERALLVACASSEEISAWVKAVPGFTETLAACLEEESRIVPFMASSNYSAMSSPRAPTSTPSHRVLYYYLFQALNSTSSDTIDESIAKLLREECPSVTSYLSGSDHGDHDGHGDSIMVDSMDELHRHLQLMYTVHQARQGRKIWGSECDKVLVDIGSVLRKELIERSFLSSSASSLTEKCMDRDDADEEKIMAGSETRAMALKERRARVLQPECLRMIKVMTSQPEISKKCE